ncbi:MAG: protein-methionine-sulfoxide reductase catalytic subunit MsrP [Desulfocurvibacter africanus]
MRWRKSSISLPSADPTPEEFFRCRRTLLKAMGLAGMAGTLGPLLAACDLWGRETRQVEDTLVELRTLKAVPNQTFGPEQLGQPLTERRATAVVNNFYEFTTGKDVWRYVEDFVARPWRFEVSGLVERPVTFDMADILAGKSLGELEERLYRFRCVEAWAMNVPWIGVPFHRVIEAARPRPEAKYVRLLSFLRPEQAPGQQSGAPYLRLWPYFEGLTLPEALNETALLAVGMYGHELPKQSGAPVRLVLPWKYGYKGPKSITRIELTAERPPTFWSALAPDEYDFWSNVDPDTPHPRWSQATERMLGTGERRPTLPFNGYGEFVAGLYAELDKNDPRYGFGLNA